MMEVLLDGRALAPAPTLADAIARACTQAETTGRVVVEAALDGVPVGPDAFGPGASPLTGRRVDFTSAIPRDLARFALESAATALDELKPQHRAAAENVRDGNIEPAMAALSTVLTTWDQAKAALERSAAMLGVGPETPGNTGSRGGSRGGDGGEEGRESGRRGVQWETISPALASLAGRLAEIKRSLVARDWSGLADVLEYDMDKQAEDFADVLRGFARSAASTAPPTNRT